MTDEVKKLIESVKIHWTGDVKRLVGIPRRYVLKSDFDRVVEELTKWNKVEDGLDFRDKNEQILCKLVSGTMCILVAKNVYSWVGKYIGDGLVEWRYIY